MKHNGYQKNESEQIDSVRPICVRCALCHCGDAAEAIHVLTAAGTLVALFSLGAFLRGLESDRNLKAIEGALNELDVITGGLRIIGRDADAVDLRRVDLPTEPGPIEVAQLCRTKKGQWFEHRFELSRTHRVYGNRVRLLTESEARGWLSYNINAYEREFGPAEVA